mgnify:CR=1 FL=1
MLVLARREGEEIVIGDDIVIKVVNVDEKRGIIRLGITAPRDVAVDRKEIRESKDFDAKQQ